MSRAPDASLEDRIAFARWLLAAHAITTPKEAIDAVESGPEYEDDWEAWREETGREEVDDE